MALNAALAAGSCFAVARVVTQIGAEALEPVDVTAPPPARIEDAGPQHAAAPSMILERNLFGAQLAGDVQVEEEPTQVEEPLTETKLPLRLLGTAAASEVERSRAAIEDEKTRKHMVVAVGDRLEGHSRVRVEAIERTRVILENAGRREELLLFEGEPRVPNQPARRAARQARRAQRDKSRNRASERLDALAGKDGQGISRLLSQARIVPHYDEGEMVGMKIDAIKANSLFQQVGLENGDVITQVNGILFDRPEAASAIFDELTSADAIEIAALRGDATINMSADAADLVQEER
ncbi:MAG: hypothetical protein JRF61_28460 [Deltaproteobacteria bacterium]|jgi:general secretion pathway protein C|nr:hypothetical protein [Deltaproteobacteria bacterium]